MKRFLLIFFIFINLPVFSTDLEGTQDALAAQQMENMLKGILVQHALNTVPSSPSRAFDDFVSVLPQHMHAPLKGALHSYALPQSSLWREFLGDIERNHSSADGSGYMKMALIALEELFNHNLVFLIFQEGSDLHEAKKNKQALHVLTSILPLNVITFLDKIKAIKPYEETAFDQVSLQLDQTVRTKPSPLPQLDHLALVLIREKIQEKRHDHFYLRATNRLREMDDMGAIELFMQMLPQHIHTAMNELLKTTELRVFTLRQMCENFYSAHKKDLLHIQDQALVKALESAEKFMIVSVDPYYYTDV